MRARKVFLSGMTCSCLIAIVFTFLFNTNTQAASSHVTMNPLVLSQTQTTTRWTNWDQYDGSPARFNRTEKTLSTKNVASLQPVWGQYLDDSITTSPVTVNGVVYAVGFSGTVGAYDAHTGKKLWTTVLQWPKIPGWPQNDLYSTPAVDNDMLYVASDYGNIFALNTRTGHQVWYNHTGALFSESSIAVANGLIYFTTTGVEGVTNTTTTLYALHEKTGKVAWTSLFKDVTTGGSPLVVNNILYIATEVDKHYLLAFNATTGKLLWKAAGFIAGGVVVDNNTVYGSYADPQTHKNGLAAVNATTGELLWKNSFITKYTVQNFAVGNGKIYGSGDEPASGTSYGYQPYVYAFNASNGKLIWKDKLANDEIGYSDATLANGVVYFASNGASAFFSAYDAQNGVELWESGQTFGSQLSTPLVANGMLYTTSNSGYLVALAPKK